MAETWGQGVEDDGLFGRGGKGGAQGADGEDFEELGDVVFVRLLGLAACGEGFEDVGCVLFFEICLFVYQSYFILSTKQRGK